MAQSEDEVREMHLNTKNFGWEEEPNEKLMKLFVVEEVGEAMRVHAETKLLCVGARILSFSF